MTRAIQLPRDLNGHPNGPRTIKHTLPIGIAPGSAIFPRAIAHGWGFAGRVESAALGTAASWPRRLFGLLRRDLFCRRHSIKLPINGVLLSVLTGVRSR